MLVGGSWKIHAKYAVCRPLVPRLSAFTWNSEPGELCSSLRKSDTTKFKAPNQMPSLNPIFYNSVFDSPSQRQRTRLEGLFAPSHPLPAEGLPVGVYWWYASLTASMRISVVCRNPCSTPSNSKDDKYAQSTLPPAQWKMSK